MGSAFTSIVNSLVNDMFLPFISLATPTQLSNQFILLRCPRWPNNTEKPCNKSMYVTPNDGRIVLMKIVCEQLSSLIFSLSQ